MKRTVQSPRSVSASTHHLPLHGFTHKHQFPFPLDLPVRVHTPHLVRRVVPGILELGRIGPGGRDIDVPRRSLPQCLVRPVSIKLAPHAIKPPLLGLARGRGCQRRLLLQRQVKPLVAPVLLRVPRIDPIQVNSQLQPPHRQLREPARARRRERRSVVGAQRAGQPIFAKRPLEPRPYALRGRRHNPTTQYKSTAGVGHRQRIAARPIRRPKPPLKIRAPHIVRGARGGKRLRHGHHDSAPAGGAGSAPRAATDRPSCSSRATRCPAPARVKHGPEFLGPPARMRAPQGEHRGAKVLGHRPAVRVRRPRSLGQPMPRVHLIAVDPLVGRLPTNVVSLRELRHRPFISQPVGDERHALIHGAGLRPGHPASLADRSVDLLPMYPVYSVHQSICIRSQTSAKTAKPPDSASTSARPT